MSKDFSKYQQNVIRNYYEHRDTIRAQKLAELVTEIWLAQGSTKAAKLWEQAGKELLAAGVDANKVVRLIKDRQAEDLAELVRQLDAGQKPAAQQTAPPAPSSAPTPPQTTGTPVGQSGQSGQSGQEGHGGQSADDLDAQLKRAMGAFKKKLKTMRLDDESRLGGRYVTRGTSSTISAITPPRDFPDSIWKELVRQGRLKAAGQGMYQMP